MMIKKFFNILNFSTKLIACTYLTCPYLFAADQIMATQPTFPSHLDDFTFVEYRSGAGGGVSIIEQNGTKYALKAAENSEYLKQEALANYLYLEFGVRAPHFALYNTLGNLANNPDIQNHIPTRTNLFMLSEFIDGESLNAITDTELKDKLLTELRANFMVDAFLSNWDLHGDNVRLDKNGQVVRVDNGGSLDAHAAGNWKSAVDGWDPLTVSDIRTMLNPGNQKEYCRNLAQADIISQLPSLLPKQSAVLTRIITFAKAVGLKDYETLFNRILKRFEYLQLLQSRSSLSLADKDELAGLSAAGIFVTTLIDGVPHTLIAKRAGSGLWCNPGGKSDKQDQFLYDSAARETREETHGKILITADELRHKPSHDLLPDYASNSEAKDIRYRMYFADHPYVAPSELLTTDSSNQDSELTEFMWIPTQVLIDPDPIITLDDGRTLELYPPFHKMLTQSSVVDRINQITEGKRLPTLHTQGIENPSPWINSLSLSDLTVKWSDPTAPDAIVYPQLSDSWGKPLSLKKVMNADGKIVLSEQKFGNPYADARQLAWATLAHSQCMAELKSRFRQQDKADLPPPQLGASDLHLKRTLKDKWVDITPGSSDELAKTKQNIEALILNTLSPFTETYAQALTTERRYPNHIASYHGTIPEIAAATSFFTEMRHLLATDRTQSLFMRGTDRAFIHPDVDAFKEHFRNEDGSINNYEDSDKGRYTEMGLSVVPFLLNGPTTSYYEDGSSAKIFYGQSLINSMLAYLGLNLEDEQWEQVFAPYLSTADGKRNGALYQILIPYNVALKTSYMSVAGGTEAIFKQFDGTLSSSVAPMQLLKSDPDAFWNDYDHQAHISDSKELIHDSLQFRHYMKPEYWQQNTIFEYRHFPVNTKAVKLLTERFTVQFLFNNREIPEGTFYSPSISGISDPYALRRLYRFVYEGSTGIPLTEKPISVDMLGEFLDKGDLVGLNLIVSKYPDLDLMAPIQLLGGKGRSGKNEKEYPLKIIYDQAIESENISANVAEMGLAILDHILGKTTITRLIESNDDLKYPAVYFTMAKRNQRTIDKMAARGLRVSAQTVFRVISTLGNPETVTPEADHAFFETSLTKLSRNSQKPEYVKKGLSADYSVKDYGPLKVPPLINALISGNRNAFLFLANLGKSYDYAGYESTAYKGLNLFHFMNDAMDAADAFLDQFLSLAKTIDQSLLTKWLGSSYIKTYNPNECIYDYYNATPLMKNFLCDDQTFEFLLDFAQRNNWVGIESEYNSILTNLANPFLFEFELAKQRIDQLPAEIISRLLRKPIQVPYMRKKSPMPILLSSIGMPENYYNYLLELSAKHGYAGILDVSEEYLEEYFAGYVMDGDKIQEIIRSHADRLPSTLIAFDYPFGIYRYYTVCRYENLRDDHLKGLQAAGRYDPIEKFIDRTIELGFASAPKRMNFFRAISILDFSKLPASTISKLDNIKSMKGVSNIEEQLNQADQNNLKPIWSVAIMNYFDPKNFQNFKFLFEVSQNYDLDKIFLGEENQSEWKKYWDSFSPYNDEKVNTFMYIVQFLADNPAKASVAWKTIGQNKVYSILHNEKLPDKIKLLFIELILDGTHPHIDKNKLRLTESIFSDIKEGKYGLLEGYIDLQHKFGFPAGSMDVNPLHMLASLNFNALPEETMLKIETLRRIQAHPGIRAQLAQTPTTLMQLDYCDDLVRESDSPVVRSVWQNRPRRSIFETPSNLDQSKVSLFLDLEYNHDFPSLLDPNKLYYIIQRAGSISHKIFESIVDDPDRFHLSQILKKSPWAMKSLFFKFDKDSARKLQLLEYIQTDPELTKIFHGYCYNISITIDAVSLI